MHEGTNMIYGVATLSICMMAGSFIGNLLGLLTGINSDVGGVGFAMFLLMIVSNSKWFDKRVNSSFNAGIDFWKGMYIPIVIAMSASQNVFNALSAGSLAIFAGLLAVAFGFALLPVLNRMSNKSTR